MNMLATLAPKSDQLNADDLLGRTLTVRITNVSMNTSADQPVAVHFEGDQGKPFKPCKSMRRVMVQIWGPDASAYAGRSMTLYRDAAVKFGGLDVGGIRISHMSGLDRDVTMALTVTKGAKKAFTVKPLREEQKPEPKLPILSPDMKLAEVRPSAWLPAARKALSAFTTYERVEQWSTAMREHQAAVPEEMWSALLDATTDRADALAAVESTGGTTHD